MSDWPLLPQNGLRGLLPLSSSARPPARASSTSALGHSAVRWRPVMRARGLSSRIAQRQDQAASRRPLRAERL